MHAARTVIALLALMVTSRMGSAFDVPCAQQCGMEAEQAFHQCLEQGGTDDDCKAAAAQTFESCIATNCTIDPQDCQTVCDGVATNVQTVCLGTCADGDPCADLCQRAHDVALERCTKELCGTPDPGCGDDPLKCCMTSCGDLAHGVFADCIATEGDGAKELCEERARQAFAECAEQQCGRPPEVPCDERCAHRAAELHQHCLDAGKPADMCDALAASAETACVAEHCAEPGDTCEESCQSSAESAFLACVAAGGTEADCQLTAEGNRDACVDAHCTVPDAACADRCAAAVDALVAACMDAGGDEAFCKARGDAALRHCIDEHCDDADVPEPTCEERCADHGQHELQRCIADGGTEADCKAMAMMDFQSCLAMHCNPDDSCVARCDRRAARAERRCLKGGQDAGTCAQVAADVSAACQADRCAPTPPDTCQSDCETHAAEVEQGCLAAGTPEADCAAAKQGVLDQCAADCGPAPDQTCTETCEDTAQARFESVLEDSGNEHRAERRAQHTFRRCTRTCD